MENAQVKITPELVIDIILRRRWVIMVPICVMLVVGIFLTIFLPKIYEAKTLILVEGQRVPQNYVQSIVTEDTAQRINTISQQILSRTNLEKVIADFGLFSGEEYQKMFLEDKVANLRERIAVDVITDKRSRSGATEAFTISFKGKDPQKVMRVTNGLASYFIDENLKVREYQATGTSSFLESELEAMRLRLEQVEESMKNYRKANMGELPEQLETNLRILERLQANLSDRQQGLRQAKSLLSQLKKQATSNEPSVVVISGPQGQQNQGVATLDQLLAELDSLQARYTDKHPDIQRLKRQIAELQTKTDDSSDTANLSQKIPYELRQQITETQREIALIETDIQDLTVQINNYQKRIENIPKREQELLSLKRDYENIQTTYDSLLARKLEADIAVNMERKQKGEQFRIIDSARLPQRPVEPDMKKIFLLVIASGFSIGGGMAFALEFLLKPAYRNPDEIEKSYEMPVLVMIPQLLKPRQIFLKKADNVASVFFSFFLFALLGVFGVLSFLGPEQALEILRNLS